MLDKEGLILAILMGIAIYMLAGPPYLLLMLTFLFLAVAATKYEHTAKRELGLYEHERGWENVLSNGLLPTILAGLHPSIGLSPYLGAIAAITADKFASELGVLSGKAFSLPRLEPVKPGQSGAVSNLGLALSFGGGTLIGLTSVYLFSLTPTHALLLGGIGFAGSFVDSLLGVLEERGIGTKGTTNFFCSLTGALLAYVFIPL